MVATVKKKESSLRHELALTPSCSGNVQHFLQKFLHAYSLRCSAGSLVAQDKPKAAKLASTTSAAERNSTSSLDHTNCCSSTSSSMSVGENQKQYPQNVLNGWCFVFKSKGAINHGPCPEWKSWSREIWRCRALFPLFLFWDCNVPDVENRGGESPVFLKKHQSHFVGWFSQVFHVDEWPVVLCCTFWFQIGITVWIQDLYLIIQCPTVG